MTLDMTDVKKNEIGSAGKKTSLKVSQDLQNLISNNSELGSRLLSLLLVSSGNGKEIIDAINNGDLDKIQNLDIDLNLGIQEVRLEGGKGADSKSKSGQPAVDEIKNIPDQDVEKGSTTSQSDKKRRNIEASARFRIRKKLREQEKLDKIKELNSKINGLYKNIDRLLEENRTWRAKLEELNEKKSKELLERIKSRNAMSP